jgi:hypothetical protein
VNSSSPDPGWYPDPRKPTRDRYWDGSQWTDKTRKKQGGGFRAAYGRLPRWAQIAIPIVAILVVVSAVAGGGESDNKDTAGTSSATTTKAETKAAASSEPDEGNDPSENASDSNTPRRAAGTPDLVSSQIGLEHPGAAVR